MKKEIPEYQRSVIAEPSQQLSEHVRAPEGQDLSTQSIKGFGKAYAQIGEIMGGNYRNIGAIGLQIAQNAAIERAALDGIKAGQTPGKKLLPAFTESDKAFVNAYKQEEYSTVTRQAESFLNKIYNEVSQNPTQEGIDKFEQFSKGNVDNFTDLLSEENRPKFKRSLESAYESKYYKLVNALEHKNNQLMAHNFKLNYNNALEQIQEFQSSYQPDKAKDVINNNVEYIRSLIGSDTIPTKDDAESYINALEQTNNFARVQAEFQNDLENGMASDTLAKVASLPNTAVNQSLKKSLLKQFQQYNSLLSSKSHAAKQEGLAASNRGTLTPAQMVELEKQMTEKDLVDFNYQVSKNAKDGLNTSNAVNYIDENINNPIKLSKANPKQLDAWFNNQLINYQKLNNEEPGIFEKTSIASRIPLPIPSFINELEASIKDGDAGQAHGAAVAINVLQSNNQSSIKRIDKDVQDIAGLYKYYAQNPAYSGQAGIDRARNDVLGLTPEIKEQRLRIYNNWIRDKEYRDDAIISKRLSNDLGANPTFGSKKALPPGLTSVYLSAMKGAILNSGNEKVAHQRVISNLKETIQPTKTNNKEELMSLPPEKYLSEYGYFQVNDKIRALKDIINQNKERQDKNQFIFNEIEWEGREPEISDIFSKPAIKGDIYLNIDGVKRKIEIQSDTLTQFSETGQPSWGFWYVDDYGIRQPLTDPNSGKGVYRWTPNLESLEESSVLANKLISANTTILDEFNE